MFSDQALADQLKRVSAKNYRIGIIGLGYVGIPLALTACKAGFSVVGFDIDTKRVDQINRGESFIKHIPTEAIGAALYADPRLYSRAQDKYLLCKRP